MISTLRLISALTLYWAGSEMLCLKYLFCTHEFDLPQIGKRGPDGTLTWPCHKCGKPFQVEYGLQVKGKIINSAQSKPRKGVKIDERVQ